MPIARSYALNALVVASAACAVAVAVTPFAGAEKALGSPRSIDRAAACKDDPFACARQNSEPAWSPDGRRIAFQSEPPSNCANGGCDVTPTVLEVMNADGSGLRRLLASTGSGDAYALSWSPDGKQIAFDQSDAIYVMSADGSRKLWLARGDQPAWSPDGRKIAFAGAGFAGLRIMNADGSHVRSLTPNPPESSSSEGDAYPAWSPDGRKVVFTRNGHQIDVINADGSGFRRLTRVSTFNPAESWSPDGRTIAFDDAGEIYLMNADGSHRRLLPHDGSIQDLEGPAWSPDGRTIAFDAAPTDARNADRDIYVVNLDGTNLRRLTSPAQAKKDGVPKPAAPLRSEQARVAVIPAVLAKARAIGVRRSDLPGKGWRSSSFSSTFVKARCPYYDPDGSDLTINGEAASTPFALPSDSIVASTTAIFENAAQGQTAYSRITQRALPCCLAQTIRNSSDDPSLFATVSIGAVAFPRVADRATLYRIVLAYKGAPRHAVLLNLDELVINRANVVVGIVFLGVGKPFGSAFERSVATKVAARMAAG
jgi:TolB protein